jgi:hypothetical protein
MPLKLQYVTFWVTTKFTYLGYKSVILIESKSKKRKVCYMCYFYSPLLSFVFASFTFSFVNQLQTAYNTVVLVMENIFHSGLDGTVILYTILACFVT